MLGSHVCRQCRTRLNPQRASSRITQWQSRATFISLRNKQQQNGPDQVEAPPHTEKTQTSPQADQRPSYDLFDRAKIGPEARQPGRVGRYSRYMRETDVAPEAMEDVPGTPAAAAEEGKINAEDEVKTYAPLILRALRDKGVRAGWPLFDKIYTSADCEALTKPSTLDIHIINEKRFFPEVLARVLKEFCEGQGEPVVTPTTALLKYEQLGFAPPGLWVKNVIEPLTYQVMLAANGVSKKPQRDLPSLLSELVSVWRLFFQCKGAGNKPLDAVDPEWNLPAVDAIPHVFPTVDFNVRLQDFHPRCVGSPALGFCAIYFFNLSDAINSVESLRLEAAPFQNLLVRVLAGSRVNAVLKHPAFSRAFQALPQEIQVEITREVESAVPKAEAAIGLQSVASKKTSGSSGNKSAEPATTDLESFNLKVINRAIEARSSPMILEKHWKRIIRDYTQSGKTAIPPSIYNAFLSGYLILRQAPRSVEVWNHMISSGVRPELPTWVAMLEGCEKAKDLEGFNAMWQRMQSMGFEPDNYAWTTRVHGLMSFRQIDAGLRTLDDMGKRWRAAETAKHAPVSNSRSSKGSKNPLNPAKGVNNCTKPTVEVINGAMSGIVALPQSARISHSKRINYVQKILQWGLQFDVKPDTRTYNILVQLYLNAGDYATASSILQQMETNGVGADVSTHTMLIVAALENGSLDSLSEAERASRLIQMFESLEAGGLRPNNYTYAAAIDGLLKQYGSHSAAHALVDHMRSRNLSPSVHIYTSLTTHYFQQSPPAIAAVDSLLTHIFDSPHTDSDKTFFDRVLEGYAAHAEVGRMMSVLTRMSKRGHHPSFRALTAVIQALVNAGDVDRARFIVHDVKRGEGIAMGGVTGAFNDESHFLHVAERLGLVGEGEERMGDAFKIRKDMRVLDERIEGAIRREQGESGETQTTQQEEGLQEDSVPEHSADRQKSAQGLDDDIHGFLAGEGAKAGSR